MRVDRYTLEALAEWDGITNLPKDHKCSLAQYAELEKHALKEGTLLAREKFKASLKDNTTPLDMTTLLIKLFKNELLNADNSNLLLKIMRGCKRGQMRLMNLLPNKTPIAHKTGTLTGFTSDVGIISLPNNAGNIAISAYIKNSPKDLVNNERILAEVGRTVYDYFLTHQ